MSDETTTASTPQGCIWNLDVLDRDQDRLLLQPHKGASGTVDEPDDAEDP